MKQDSLLPRLIIGLLLAVMLAYLAFSVLKTLTNPYQFVAVYSDTVEETLTMNTWAFREEQRLAGATGRLSYRLDEGEKARAGQLAVISYSSQQALLQQQKIRSMRAQVEQLGYALSNEAPTGTNLETQALQTYAGLQGASAGGDFSRLATQADAYKKLVLRREYLQSDQTASEMGLASLELTAQLNTLQTQTADEAQSLYTPAAGLFSLYVDGYESLLAPSLLRSDLTPAQLKELVAQTPSSNDGAVGKVVSGSTWYLALRAAETDLALFQRQSEVSVRISSLAEAIPMAIEQVGAATEGEGVVVLSSRHDLDQALTLREQTASIVFKTASGIRVPKSALRAQEDGSAGVFTVTGARAELKPVTVLAEDLNDYIVVANPADKLDKRVLRSGDQVIVSAAELYEGKVVR